MAQKNLAKIAWSGEMFHWQYKWEFQDINFHFPQNLPCVPFFRAFICLIKKTAK